MSLSIDTNPTFLPPPQGAWRQICAAAPCIYYFTFNITIKYNVVFVFIKFTYIWSFCFVLVPSNFLAALITPRIRKRGDCHRCNSTWYRSRAVVPSSSFRYVYYQAVKNAPAIITERFFGRTSGSGSGSGSGP